MSKLFVDNGFLAKSGSLLKHLEKGDTLAVEAARVPYLELSDIARDVEGFTGRTDRSDNSNFSVGYLFEPLIGENFVLFGPSQPETPMVFMNPCLVHCFRNYRDTSTP